MNFSTRNTGALSPAGPIPFARCPQTLRRLSHAPYILLCISLLALGCKPNALATSEQKNPLLDYKPLMQYSLALEDLPTSIDSIHFYDKNIRMRNPYLANAMQTIEDSVQGTILVGLLVDHRNALFIDSVISLYGYPGADLVGDSLSYIAAMVIHHYPSVEFKRKHLPVLFEWLDEDPSHVQLVMGIIDRLYFRERGTYLMLSPHPTAVYDESEEAEEFRARIRAISKKREENQDN